MSNEDIMICAICGRVLDRFVEHGTGRVAFQHTIQDSSPEDHPAIPIPDPEMQKQKIGRCDFCNADFPKWGIPAREFEMPGLPGHFSDGDWAACDTCRILIEKNRWDTLARRAVENHQGNPLVTKEVIKANLVTMYNRLRKNITGPAYSLTTEDTQ